METVLFMNTAIMLETVKILIYGGVLNETTSSPRDLELPWYYQRERTSK